MLPRRPIPPGRHPRTGSAARRASPGASSAPPRPGANPAPLSRRAGPCAARPRRWRGAAPPPPTRPAWRRGAAAGRTPAGRARPCSPTADPAGEQAVRLGLLGVVRARPEEVEVAALVGLQDVVEEQRAVAAPVAGLGGPEALEPRGDLVAGHVDVDAARVDVELDRVAVAEGAERPSGGGLRRDV